MNLAVTDDAWRGEPPKVASRGEANAPWSEPNGAIASPATCGLDIPVGLGEVKVADRAGQVLVAYGVGSCIIVCAWDPIDRVGGMAHIVLPESPTGVSGDGRYADGAVPLLLGHLGTRRTRRDRLIVKLAGGAWVLGPKSDGETIGTRNARAARDALARRGLVPAAEDVGGRHGRTVRFEVGNGCVYVKTLGQDRVIL